MRFMVSNPNLDDTKKKEIFEQLSEVGINWFSYFIKIGLVDQAEWNGPILSIIM
jgi:hypothetical protein